MAKKKVVGEEKFFRQPETAQTEVKKIPLFFLDKKTKKCQKLPVVDDMNSVRLNLLSSL